ncbi:MAG: glycosyltransferase, partial [Gammaproteobacteria bacterium]|nr:glycosyltransferase [Gammaproteobacteria bacterium]
MTQRVAIYVQHLLGAGHLVRAMSLAGSLSRCGHQVLLLSGGFPIGRAAEGYQYFQLPPTRAIEGDFNCLVDEYGNAVDESWRKSRRLTLMAEVVKFEPDLVITETFPFGRRQFRFELEPLIHWVKRQPSVRLMASIRDVLQRRSEAKNRLAAEIIEHYYDGVLIHADQSLFKLEASFPLSHEIEDKLIYTGYIHQPASIQTTSLQKAEGYCDGQDEILVSGGSGTVSAGMLETARLARPLSSAKSRVWRLLTGRDLSVAAQSPEAGLIIEPNRPDFFILLSRCALSVSQAGYNTTLDVLASGARSLMIPFAGDGETEQNDRAQALENTGRVLRIAEPDLTPGNLARA